MNIKLKREFSWDIQDTIQHFYQVIGTNNITAIIQASNVNEVCQKFSQRNPDIKIKIINQYLRPAFGPSDDDPTAKKNIPLPKPPDCGDCCDVLFRPK